MAGKIAMEKGQVVKILTYYRNIDGEIRLYQSLVDDLESYYDTLGGVNIDGMPKGQNHISNPTEATALNLPPDLRESIEMYTEKISELRALKVQTLKEVSRLEHRMKAVIVDYYLHGLKWEQVSARNHYSERQCKNIRNAAVESLAQRFSENAVIAGFEIPA